MRPLSRPGPPKGDCPKGLSKRTDKCSHEKWWECECPWSAEYHNIRRNLNAWWREFAPEGKAKSLPDYATAKRVFVHFQDWVDDGAKEKSVIETGTFGELVALFKQKKVGIKLVEAKAGPRKGKMVEKLSGVTSDGKPGEHDPAVLYMLDDLNEKFGKQKIADLEKRTIVFEAFLDELQGKRKWGHGDPLRAVRTRNRWFQLGRRLFNFAIQKELATRNPFGKGDFTYQPEAGNRERRIEESLQKAVLEVFKQKTLNTLTSEWPHLSEELEARWYAAIKGGLRRTEMLKVQNKHCKRIPGQGYEILLPPMNTKAGKTTSKTLYCYILDARLIEIIDARKFLGPDKYTFGTIEGDRIQDFDKSWESLFELAGLNPKRTEGMLPPRYNPDCYTWHDLRHEYISRLVEEGVTLKVLTETARISLKVADRYMAAKKEHIWEAVSRV